MKYDDKFRKEAVRLSMEIGIAEAAKKLGVPYYTLSEWRKSRSNHLIKEELRKDDEVKKMSNAELQELVERQREEIARLSKEKHEITEANEILKEALGFFAQDRKKK